MLSTLAQIVVISFALIGAGFMLWLICQFVAAFREANYELTQKGRVPCGAPTVFDHERSESLKAALDILKKKELDNDQAESHI